MSLFKKKETKVSVCTCNSNCSTNEITEIKPVNDCYEKKVDEIHSIKVLGSGCKNCHSLLQSTEKAVKSMGLTIEVEYVTDMQTIMEYGVMSMPALVVNDQIISMGKVLNAEKVEQLLRKSTNLSF